ncbi:MAG: Eco57I restriction-modification methylase domain-containing protein [Candidatus Hodarchaeota archaeon]
MSGKKMNLEKNISQKRQNGIYHTPYTTAQHMVNIILPFITEHTKILDPAAGDGVFVEILIDHGVDPAKITAHDINDEKILSLTKLGVNAELKDTLLDEYEKKDIIIGNPPYKSRRNSTYIKENKRKLKDRYGFIGLHNLYSLFIVNAIQNLNNKGVICLIVEDGFLTNRYYYSLRKFILDNCKILEIKLAPRRLFHQSKADVRTAIVTLQKIKLSTYLENNHKMRLIDRLMTEEEYEKPPRVQMIPQIDFRKMPDLKFFVGIPRSIIKFIQNSNIKFGDFAKGGTGISTGDDKKYLRQAREVKNDPKWVGFYKSGQRTPYYYQTPFYIEKDYQKNASNDPKNFLVRNKQFFFKEGITCSSVGRKFSAAYMPPGNLFGINANFFFKDKNDLFFALGFLNCKITQYFARKVVNRSNIVATSFIKEIPFIIPSVKQKEKVVKLVKTMVTSLMQDPNSKFSSVQNQIDEIFFKIYNINECDRSEIMDFCENIMERA